MNISRSKVVAGVGLLGLLLGVCTWLATAPKYASSARIRVESGPAVPKDLADKRILVEATNLLSRSMLHTLIQKYQLYPAEQTIRPLPEVVAEMKKNIIVRLVDFGHSSVYEIEFRYKNPSLAKLVVRDLATRLGGPVIGGPSLRTTLVSPNLPLLCLSGLAIGLLVGVAINLSVRFGGAE